MITYTDFRANFNALVGVFDLRTGEAVPSLGAEPLPDGPVTDGLVLNRLGFTAVHTNLNGNTLTWHHNGQPESATLG